MLKSKTLPGRKWDSSKKVWIIPRSNEDDAWKIMNSLGIDLNRKFEVDIHEPETEEEEEAYDRIANLLPEKEQYKEKKSIVSFSQSRIAEISRIEDKYTVSIYERQTGDLIWRGVSESLTLLDESLLDARIKACINVRYSSPSYIWLSLIQQRNQKEVSTEAEDDGSSTSLKTKILTFGKYKGQSLASVPTTYLKWLVQHARVMREENRKFALLAKAIIEEA